MLIMSAVVNAVILNHCAAEKKDLGELLLSLCYLPTAGRLTVTVVKARSLKAMDITGSSALTSRSDGTYNLVEINQAACGVTDPYVKVSLICHSKRIKKKKTSVKKSTLHPVYNEALVYDVPAENIEDVDLAVKVIDYDMVGANEVMGCCAIGNSCVGPGRDHWLEMLENPRKPVAQWYSLVDSLPPALDRKTSPVRCLNMR
ncbi:SYT9 [Cordylochernes scorpioides]|uniref:SYT9 n=1 Tax=Cordylochernes scorpioides TaxID=51811 RepID=A0ABY6KGV4_9ARAC|nr:SYT9 [Cordylochernes scorpioides]